MSLKPRRKASLISHSYFQKSITYRLGVSFPFLLHKLLSEKGKGVCMIDVVNLQAIIEDYQRQMKPKRVASSVKRILSLQKEDRRLNGQKS